MCGVMNGLSLHSKFILMEELFALVTTVSHYKTLHFQNRIYVMTHDSIGLGEDGQHINQ